MCAMTSFMTILYSMGIMHCCIYVTYSILFILEGPVRMAIGAVLMPRMRRKGIYISMVLSAVLFIITVLINDFDTDGSLGSLKLVTGVLAKFVTTFYFAFAYTMMGEMNPTGIRQRVTSVQV